MKKNEQNSGPARPAGNRGAWLIIAVFVFFSLLVGVLDVQNLVHLFNFQGANWSLANLPVALGFLLILLFMVKLVFLFTHETWSRWLSLGVVLSYLFVSLLALGTGDYFPRRIEKVVNDNRAKAAERFARLRTWLEKTILAAENGYKKPYDEAVNANIRYETEHGDCRAKCKKDKELRKESGKHWKEYVGNLREPFEKLRKWKSKHFDKQEIKPSFAAAESMVKKANELVGQLTQRVENIVLHVQEERVSAVEYFSVTSVARKQKMGNQAAGGVVGKDAAPKVEWPVWRGISKEQRKELHISRSGHASFLEIFVAGLKTVWVPIILLILLILDLVVENLQTDRLKQEMFAHGEMAGCFTNEIGDVPIEVRPRAFLSDWKNYLENPAEKKSRLLAPVRLVYRRAENREADPVFDTLSWAVERLCNGHSMGRFRKIISTLASCEPGKVSLDVGLKFLLESKNVTGLMTRPRDPTAAIDPFTLAKKIRKILEQAGSLLPIEVGFSQAELVESLDKDSEPHENEDLFVYRPVEKMALASKVIERLKDCGLEQYDRELADALVQREGDKLVVHRKVCILIEDKMLLERLMKSSRSTGTAVVVESLAKLLEIKNQVENPTRGDLPGLDRLVSLEKDLRRVPKSSWQKLPGAPLCLWKEIARAYTHKADVKNARAYLKKMQAFRLKLESGGSDIEQLQDYLIEAELVLANSLADELNYEDALKNVDEVLAEYGSAESYAVQKARSAKGHILTVCGRSQEAVPYLTIAYERAHQKERLQPGITLAMAYIAQKNRDMLKKAERQLNQLADLLKSDHYIIDRPGNTAWLRLARVKCAYVYACRLRRNIGNEAENKLEQMEMLLKDTGRTDVELQYYDQFALHLCRLLKCLVRSEADPAGERLYIGLVSQVNNDLKARRVNILTCLRTLMIASYLWAVESIGCDADERLDWLKKARDGWAGFTAYRPDATGKDDRPLDNYFRRITALKPGDTGQAAAEICELLQQAEYLPAILPLNLAG